jgi:hypothetical protein
MRGGTALDAQDRYNGRQNRSACGTMGVGKDGLLQELTAHGGRPWKSWAEAVIAKAAGMASIVSFIVIVVCEG